MKRFYFIVTFLLIALTACTPSRKEIGGRFWKVDNPDQRPNMSKDTYDKGALQDVKIINPTSSIKNFSKTSKSFANDSARSLSRDGTRSQHLIRRISLSDTNQVNKELEQNLEIIDPNEHIKDLETLPVSLQFNSINIRSALRLFAGLAKRNIVIGDEVSGDITLDFQDINWGSAVYAILDMNDLVMLIDKKSGLLRVHTKENYIDRQKTKVEQSKQLSGQTASTGSSTTDTASTEDGDEEENQDVAIFRVFNQTSDNLRGPLEALAEGATITNDQVNNQLLVQATPEQLDQIEKALVKLDIQKQAVMIEAFIINAEDGFTEAFDANLEAINAGTEFANTGNNLTQMVVQSPQGTATTEVQSSPISNAPRASGTLSSGLLLLGNIGRTRLRAILQATVDDTNSESISNPKLFAVDGQPANLVQGLSLIKVIPAAGDAAATTEEINLNLNLAVTPRIRGDKIEMTVALANNSLGTITTDDTPINNETINSTVQLSSGDIAVLGGVYKNTKNDTIKFIPLLHRIPILGHFFKDKTVNDTKSQLLIFVTANLV